MPAMPLQCRLVPYEWGGQPYVFQLPLLPHTFGLFADGAHGSSLGVVAPTDPAAASARPPAASSAAFAGAVPLPGELMPAMPLQCRLVPYEWGGQPYVFQLPLLPHTF